MTGIELFDNYFKQGNVFVWHRLGSNPIMCEITDIQIGEDNMHCRTSCKDGRLDWKHSHGALCKLEENAHYVYKLIEDYLEEEWMK